MIGTLLNVATILLGGILGLLAGSRIPTKFRETLISAMGLFTLAYGISMFGETANILIPLASLVLGTILGEWLKIEDGLEHLGTTLQAKVNRTDQALSANARRFVDGFVTASLLFCIGPMAILGAIQDGISGDFQMLAVKAVLDGLAAMAFASTLGVGVLFSAAVVLIYQGAISLLAQWIGQGFSTAVVNEMSAVGGVILAGIAISNLLEVKKIRTGSFLPALFIAIAIVLALNAFGVVI